MATRVYVGDISGETTKEDLENIFVKMGRLRDVWVAHNPPGFAFVDFIDPDDAARACRKLNGNIICGARAVVQIAKKQHQENGIGGGPSFQNRSQRPFQFNKRDRSRSSSPPPPQGFYNQQRGPPGPRRSPMRQQPSSPGRRRRDYSPPQRSPIRSRRMSSSPPPSQRYPPVHQSQQHPVLPPGYDYDKLYEIYARAARDEFERFRQDYEARLKRKSRSRSPRSPPPPRKRQEISDRRPQSDDMYRRDSPAKRSRRSTSPRSLHDSAQRGAVNRRHQPPMSPPSPEHDLRYVPRRGMSPDDRRRSRSISPRSSSLQRGSQRVSGHSGRPRSPAPTGRPRSPPPVPRRPASPPGVSRRPPSPRSPGDSKPAPRGGRGSPTGSRPLPPPPRRSRSSSRRSRSASLPKAYRSTGDGGLRSGRV